MRNTMILPVLLFLLVFVFCPALSFAFGAIAVADKGTNGPPVFAIITGQKTMQDAIKAALVKCTGNGGANCNIVATFERCGAVAASGKSFGVGWGITGKHARIMSLRNCGSDDCNVIANECEDY